MPDKAVELLRQRRIELAALNARHSEWAKLTEWYTRTRPIVAQYFSHGLEKLDEYVKPRWYVVIPNYLLSERTRNDPSRSEQGVKSRNDEIAVNAKNNLLAHLDTILEIVDLSSKPTEKMDQALSNSDDAPGNKNVFVVHGHDNEMKLNVARALEKLKLTPIILHERPNSGQTIIDKFEANSNVSYAVVLLSPDDIGYSQKEGANAAKPRARQNVILELGFFVGKLGRKHVFYLKPNTHLELPSDFGGVAHTDYDPAGHWRFELVRELRAVGYDVDANDLAE